MSLEKILNKNIAVIGNQSITKFLIDFLEEKKIKVKYLITLKDKKKYKITDPFEIKNKKIKKIYVNSYSLTNNQDIKKLKQLKIDFLIVFGWSRLIPEWLINNVKISVLGVHAGMYSPPRSRGRAVFNWSIIGNFKKMIFYSMELKPGIDNGNIFIKQIANISIHDDIESLYMKNSIISSEMFFKILKKWKYYKKNKIIQKNTGATYLPKRSPNDGFINWNASCNEVFNFVKALKQPYPRAFSFLKNIKIFIEDAVPFDLNISGKFSSGEIIYLFPNKNFVIKCKDGFLLVKKYSTEKKINIKQKLILKSSNIKKFNFKKI